MQEPRVEVSGKKTIIYLYFIPIKIRSPIGEYSPASWNYDMGPVVRETPAQQVALPPKRRCLGKPMLRHRAFSQCQFAKSTLLTLQRCWIAGALPTLCGITAHRSTRDRRNRNSFLFVSNHHCQGFPTTGNSKTITADCHKSAQPQKGRTNSTGVTVCIHLPR